MILAVFIQNKKRGRQYVNKFIGFPMIIDETA